MRGHVSSVRDGGGVTAVMDDPRVHDPASVEQKIEETKKKANDIINVRQRNAETLNQKMTLAQQREHEERELMIRNQNIRMQ